jgi:hypothetical protein
MKQTSDFKRVPRQGGIDHSSVAPPVPIPPGHVGPFVIPGSGRTVWWTGRVAIGLQHQPQRVHSTGQSALWIQSLLLGRKHVRGAA